MWRGRIKNFVTALVIGCLAGGFGHWKGFSPEYIDELSSAWKIFAGWFPVIVIILGLIMTNSDKKFIKKMSDYNLSAWLIEDVGICAILILCTSVLLFFHSVSFLPCSWGTTICTVAVVVTLYFLVHISWTIFKIAKYVAAEEEKNDSST